MFLSHASNDGDIADLVRARLATAGIATTDHIWERDDGDRVTLWLRDAAQAGDLVLVLLTYSASASQWLSTDIGNALSRDLDARGVDFIAVLADPIKLPSAFSERTLVDLTVDLGTGLWQLMSEVQIATSVDFSGITQHEFMQMTADLLGAMGFSVEEDTCDPAVDLRASCERRDSLGLVDIERWRVWAKLNPGPTVSLDPMTALGEPIARTAGPERGVLVTNAYLSPVVGNELKASARQSGWQLKVLGGSDLRRLLRRYSQVPAKYFRQSRPAPNGPSTAPRSMRADNS